MPVDVASGTVYLAYEDVAIPGKLELTWDRRFSSAFLNRPASDLGAGWTCRFFATLRRQELDFEFVTPEGGSEVFPDASDIVDRGGVVRIYGAFLELRRIADRYVVRRWSIESGDVVQFCFPIGHRDQVQRLASIENTAGAGVDLEWDRRGRLVAVRQRLEQRALAFRYGDDGFIAAVKLESAGDEQLLAQYEYSPDGRQLAAYDAAGFADRYEYDDAGRLRREIGKDGAVFTYSYDDRGRCFLTSGLDRYQYKRLRFIDAVRVTELVDSYGARTIYEYLPSGQIVREVDPLGGVKTTTYDEHARVVARTDFTGSVTRFAYDADGNCSTFTDALGGEYTVTYNESHLPLSMTDPMGHTWRRVYDDWTRLSASVDPLGNEWRTRYDADGNAVEMVNPLGAVRRREYTRGILTASTDWAGNVTRYRLDAFGHVTECIGPLGDVTQLRYDLLGNLIERGLPGGVTERFEYDAVGNLTTAVNANGHATNFRYGTCQRLLERIDARGGVTHFEWGTEPGRLLRVVNPAGETYEFSRDAKGLITSERAFDGAERSFAYDAAGYAVSSTNANGETIRIVRDALHRVVALDLPDGIRLDYAFDPSGNLVSAIDPAIAVSFERDPLGRIVREVQGTEWVESRYDAVGHLVGVASSLGHVAETAVDANGFITRIRTADAQALEWERNAYGQETMRRMQGGATLDQRYDQLGRLVEQLLLPSAPGGRQARVTPSRARIHRTYSYDPLGSPSSVIDGGSGRVDYAYSETERLVRAMRDPGPSEQFAYDAAGNATHAQTLDPDRVVRDDALLYAAGGRLIQKGNTHYEYDPEGRRTRKRSNAETPAEQDWQYQWDALDRLTTVVTPSGDVWTYKYDALGRRIEKRGPKTRRRFVWDKDVLLHDVGERTSVATWMFDTRTFAPLATVQNGQLYSVVTDHLGTPRELLSAAGEVVWSVKLNAWGAAVSVDRRSESSPTCPIRFQGQYFDAETGLCYNRFRYYSPEEGQYLSSDPIGLAGNNPTLYSYVGNVNLWVDPFGLVCWSTARKKFWKDEAAANPHLYSPENLARMEAGLAPRMTVQVVDNKTGAVTTRDVSMELHHTDIPQRVGGADVHDPSNLTPLTPWQHEAVDPYRHTGSTLLGVVTGVDSWGS